MKAPGYADDDLTPKDTQVSHYVNSDVRVPRRENIQVYVLEDSNRSGQSNF